MSKKVGGLMELKHDDVKKAQKNVQSNAAKPPPFAAVLGMTAGLALLSAGQAKAQDCPAGAAKDSQVVVTRASEDGKQIVISVIAFDKASGPKPADNEVLENAHVMVQYFKATGKDSGLWFTVPGCTDLVTVQHPPQDYGLPYVVCDLSAVANETEATFRAVFIPADAKTCSSSVGYTYGTTNAVWNLFEDFGNSLSEAMNVSGEVVQTVQKTQKTYKGLRCDAGVNLFCAADRTPVKAGDPILSVEFVFEKAGFFTMNVAKVDAKGIVVGNSTEIFMSEQSDGKSFRVNFGETKAIQLSSTLKIAIKVEKGPKPGTAIVTITAP